MFSVVYFSGLRYIGVLQVFASQVLRVSGSRYFGFLVPGFGWRPKAECSEEKWGHWSFDCRSGPCLVASWCWDRNRIPVGHHGSVVLDWIAWVTNLLILAEMGKRMECMVVLEGTGTSGGLRVVGKGQWNVVWMVVLEEIGNPLSFLQIRFQI